MAAVATAKAPAPAAGEAALAPRLAAAAGESLEDAVLRLWHALGAEGEARCPLCQGFMRRAGEAGTCAGCGAELS